MKRPFDHVYKIIDLLDRRERSKLFFVFGLAIFVSLVEIVGIGSVMPFMTVATQPDIIRTNRYLKWAYEAFKFDSERSFLIVLGIGVIVSIIVSNASQALLHYAKIRFTSMRRHTLSLRLLKGYLGQDYMFFLNRNSHEFVKNITTEIQQIITGTLMQFLDFTSKLIQVVLLVVFLFFVNPLSTLVISGSIAAIYGTIFVSVKRRLKRMGAERFELNATRARIVSEVFWGIKEVKIMGVESVFVDEYIPYSQQLGRNEAVNEIIGDIPKFVLETIAFTSVVLFVLISIAGSSSFSETAGMLGLYVFACYRMIPAVQSVFKAMTKLKYGVPTAERMAAEFATVADASALPRGKVEPLPFSRTIELKGIRFAYPNTQREVLQGVSIEIPANGLIGFAGKTGSGKTTLVDIILGILQAQAGRLEVDGVRIDMDTIRSWQANLGYVPQNIYLSDDTVAANIAYGVSRRSIDMAAVERAARLAQIHDFIAGEMTDGYGTKIGERGIRLSGGQRQRIGIARALYRNPKLLVMDEATSALDQHTEQAVMEAIDSLAGSRTIILIAHRLTTLKKCDRIYLLDHGVIVDTGTFADLEKANSYFKN
jgi:ABC-type bacteriocin/lantibiotic exporter with double-glycine peptidase domain